MTTEKLTDILGKINPEYTEASEATVKRIPFYKYIAAAASAAIIIAVALAVIPIFKSDIISPPEESAAVIEASAAEEPSEAFELDVSGVLDYEVKEDGSIIYTVGEKTEDGTESVTMVVASGYLACDSVAHEAVSVQTTVDKEKFWNEHYLFTSSNIEINYRGNAKISDIKSYIESENGELKEITSAKTPDYYSCKSDEIIVYVYKAGDAYRFHGIAGKNASPFSGIICAYSESGIKLWSYSIGFATNDNGYIIKTSSSEYIYEDYIIEYPAEDMEKAEIETSAEKLYELTEENMPTPEIYINEYDGSVLWSYSANCLTVDEYGNIYEWRPECLISLKDGSYINPVTNNAISKYFIAENKVYMIDTRYHLLTYEKDTGKTIADVDFGIKDIRDSESGVYYHDGLSVINVGDTIVICRKNPKNYKITYYSEDGKEITSDDPLYKSIKFKTESNGGTAYHTINGIPLKYENHYAAKCKTFGSTPVFASENKVVFMQKSDSDGTERLSYRIYGTDGLIMNTVDYTVSDIHSVSCNINRKEGLIKERPSKTLTIGNTVFEDIIDYIPLISSNGDFYFILCYENKSDVYKVNPGYETPIE